MNREALAAIDIGSNAIRLLIKYAERNGTTEFKKAAFIRVPVRLGEDVFTVGRIENEKQEELLNSMRAFSYLMRAFNVTRYRACATSAMREAGNGNEVVGLIREKASVDVEVISGVEEAETIFKAGNISGWMDRNKSYLYVDVGGGSTEITIYSNHQRVDSRSFPLGTVRIISDAVGKNAWAEFREWLRNVALPFQPAAIIGSGGNINKTHKLLGKKEKETLCYPELKMFYDRLKGMTYEERIEKLRINAYRADVIMPALKIFLTVGKCCGIDEIIVPKIGLADGIIYQLYHDAPEQIPFGK